MHTFMYNLTKRMFDVYGEHVLIRTIYNYVGAYMTVQFNTFISFLYHHIEFVINVLSRTKVSTHRLYLQSGICILLLFN